MKITSMLAGIAALALLALPAHALTLEQAQAELAGMSCSGSSCSSSQTITTTTQLPDTQEPDTILPSEDAGSTNWQGLTETCFTADISGRPFKNGPQCFVPSTLSPTTGGGGIIPGKVIPGGTLTTVACETTTKTLTYNGPFTDRANAWSVSSSTSSSEGSC